MFDATWTVDHLQEYGSTTCNVLPTTSLKHKEPEDELSPIGTLVCPAR